MKTLRLSDSEERITEAGLESGSRLAPADTVLLLVRGSELHKSIPIGITSRPVAFNQDVKALIPKAGVSSGFLLYWLLAHRNLLLSKVEHTGIGAGKLDTQVMLRLPIQLPPPSEQGLITSFMKSIDDKIELNRRMNKTLEAMARAMFKSWFVDFDSVSRKADLPSGWTVGKFGDVAENVRDQVILGESHRSTPYLGLEHMPKKSISLDEWGNAADVTSNKFAFKTGDILFGKLRPYFHKVGIAPTGGLCSTDILVIRPKEPLWFGFVLGHVSSSEMVDFADAGSTGTKMPRTSWNELSRFEIGIPPRQLAEKFNNAVLPLVQRIQANIHETRALAALRDTLLPKLMSGEICIRQAERAVETHA